MTTQYVTIANPLAAGDVVSITVAGAAPTPPPTNFTTISAAITAAPSGGSITIPPGTYREKVVVNKPLTIIAQPGVILDGTGLGVALQHGLLEVTASDVAIASTVAGTIGLSIQNSTGAGFALRGDRISVADLETHNNTQEGFTAYSTTAGHNLTLLRVHDHHNDVSGASYSGSEQGGGKALYTTSMIVDSCEFHDNGGGPGPWWDTWPTPTTIRNTGLIVRNSRFWNNHYAGAMFEISSGAVFANNVFYNNGSGTGGWYWNAGLLLSSSMNVEAYGNLFAWSPVGIAVISQNRPDSPGQTANMNLHDNVTISNTYGIAYAQDWAGALFASNNRDATTRYYGGQFAKYDNGKSTLQAAPFGGGTLLGISQAQALLTAAGVPLSQPTRPA